MSTDALLQELSRVAGALGAAVEPPGTDRLLASIAETARRLFGAHACSLALLTDEGDELVYTTAAGAGADAVTGLRLPVTRGLAGWVVQSGQPLAVADVRSDPRFAPDAAQATGYVPRAMLAAPVVSDGSVLGVLTVLDRDPARAGADDDLLLLQAFCEQAAIALEGAAAFGRASQVLLSALSSAAGSGTGLAEQLSGAGGQADDETVELAGLLARAGRVDAESRQLAVDLVRTVLTSAERRRAARPGG